LELDRHFIERNDFPAARRGYDPDEVDRHLRQIADEVAELKKAQKPSPSSLAAAAAEQVRGIVEAAENSAAEIQQKADDEARRITSDATRRARETREKADEDAAGHVQRVDDATQKMLRQASSVESEVTTLIEEVRSSASVLVERLRTGAHVVGGEVDSMKGELGDIRAARAGEEIAEAEPEVEEAPEAEVAVEEEPEVEEQPDVEETAVLEVEEEVEEPAVEEELAEEEEEEEPELVEEEAPAQAASGGRSIRGAEGARLIALNMALNGTPRDETANYLSDNFDLEDQDAILDEVYARVGDAG
jgi:DivIVA domain-containing protein